MVLSSHKALAVTFEEYIVDHDGKSLHIYLTGYIDAIYDNAYLVGGCPRRLPYRPYGEFFQHIDIHITQETKNQKKDLEKFYKSPVEPFLIAIIMKYIDCKNPESLQLTNEKKEVQIAIREIARNIIEQTKKYASPFDREKDFQYEKYLDKLKNPKKYEIKCPICKKSPDIFIPTQLPEPKIIPDTNITPSKTINSEKEKVQITIQDQPIIIKKDPEKEAKIAITPSQSKPAEPEKQKDVQPSTATIANIAEEIQPEKPKPTNIETQIVEQELAKTIEPEKPQELKTADQKKQNSVTETIEPLKLPSKDEIKNISKKAADKVRDKVDETKYQLENLKIDFDNLDAITLPDS